MRIMLMHTSLTGSTMTLSSTMMQAIKDAEDRKKENGQGRSMIFMHLSIAQGEDPKFVQVCTVSASLLLYLTPSQVFLSSACTASVAHMGFGGGSLASFTWQMHWQIVMYLEERGDSEWCW